MKCDKCGYEMEPTDRICKSCGELNRENAQNTHIMSLMKHSTNARTNAFQKSIDKNRLRESMPKQEKVRPIIEEIEDEEEINEPSEVELLMQQSGMTFNPDSEEPIYYPQQRRNTTNKDYSNEPLLQTKKTKPVKPTNPNKLNVPFALILVNIAVAAVIMFISITATSNLVANIAIGVLNIIYVISFQLLLFKAGLPWWGYFIPLYNIYLLNKIVFKNGWFFLSLFIVPVLSLLSVMIGASHFLNVLGVLEFGLILYYIVVGLYRLGEYYGANGILTLYPKLVKKV